MKHIVSRMSSYFPNRWPLSYLNLTKNMKTYIRRQQHKKKFFKPTLLSYTDQLYKPTLFSYTGQLNKPSLLSYTGQLNKPTLLNYTGQLYKPTLLSYTGQLHKFTLLSYTIRFTNLHCSVILVFANKGSHLCNQKSAFKYHSTDISM